MNHLIVCREYPPGPYPGGGIGTYVDHMSRLLAAHGETVHVIGQQCPAAPRPLESHIDGRLIVHRVPIDGPMAGRAADRGILKVLGESVLPSQTFAWHAALLAESLIQTARIDVVEAQEYEAPLYFLMLRRALGLTDARPVPLIVHLHTPTEFVFKQNEWDQSRPDYLPQKRLEDYTIGAADALLCPSRFLADIAERHYGLERSSIHVLPYPRGNADVLPRGRGTWTSGSICYVGRLETRKGVAEWVDAAVTVARDVTDLRFSFIGGDTSFSGTGDRSTRDVVRARIPEALRERFAFVDNIPREQLARHLAGSRIAVVPSRWENFPNTCIEAMSSGLPVLATPTGGMAEMVRDGVSGWIADGPDARSIERALRRALATPAAQLEQMGSAAAVDIRTLCDNDAIVRRQLDFRRCVAEHGSPRSIHLGSGCRHRTASPQVDAAPPSARPRGLALVITSVTGELTPECVDSIVRQSVKPAHVVLVAPCGSTIPTAASEWQIVFHPDVTSGAALNDALSAVGSSALGVAFIDSEWTLEPEFVAVASDVLDRCPEAGIVSPWVRDQGRVAPTAPPAFPYQWVWNDVSPCAAFRRSAIDASADARRTLAPGFALWDLANAMLAAGWRGVSYPAVLASRAGTSPCAPTPIGRPAVGYEQILSRFPDVLASDAVEVAVLLRVAMQRLEPHAAAPEPAAARTDTMTPLEVVRATPAMRRRLVARALANPAYAVRWLAWHVRRAAGGQHVFTTDPAARGRRS